ncbi:hypothetical protein DJ030_13435 [bacterium endosymbiont of Escarpia laminata]|nr:MAG: hypothetical protein DJ030_13435 [bacterium endosymbiont of Escarpia laminata]
MVFLPLYIQQTGCESIDMVLCSTCHNPMGNEQIFLRVDNNRSALCLSCYNF